VQQVVALSGHSAEEGCLLQTLHLLVNAGDLLQPASTFLEPRENARFPGRLFSESKPTAHRWIESQLRLQEQRRHGNTFAIRLKKPVVIWVPVGMEDLE